MKFTQCFSRLNTFTLVPFSPCFDVIGLPLSLRFRFERELEKNPAQEFHVLRAKKQLTKYKVTLH